MRALVGNPLGWRSKALAHVNCARSGWRPCQLDIKEVGKHSMKRFLAGALVIALIPFAQAADQVFELGRTSVRLGGIYMFEKATRRVTGNMFSLGLDFELGPGILKGADTYGSVDWFGRSANGAKGNMIPFMLNQRLKLSQSIPGGPQLYGYFGLGFVNIDVTRAQTVWGFRAGVGAGLSQSVFAETGFTYSDSANGARANSFGFWLGYKF